jgi:hypothetical protein
MVMPSRLAPLVGGGSDPLMVLAAARASVLAKEQELGQAAVLTGGTELDEEWDLRRALLFSVPVGLALWSMIVAVGIWLFG